MRACDALFFLVSSHSSSGIDVSKRSRWAILARYGDTFDQKMVARGSAFTKGASPELVKNLDRHSVTVSSEQMRAKKRDSI